MNIATLSAAALDALLARPRFEPAAFVVWRLAGGRWSRAGVASTRATADALATRCGMLAVVLPVGAAWTGTQGGRK